MTASSARSKVLVVGAAGPIGAAISSWLEECGYDVVRLDRDRADGHMGIVLDLGSSGSERILEQHSDGVLKDISHIVHAAGGAVYEEVVSPTLIPDEPVIAQSIKDNLTSTFALLKWAESATDLKSLTVLSSINASRSYGLPSYSAAKAGLQGLLSSLTVPLAKRGTRLNLLTLGTVVHESSLQLHSGHQSHFADLLNEAPLGRFISSQEISHAVQFLIENEGMCGSELVLDAAQSWSH